MRPTCRQQHQSGPDPLAGWWGPPSQRKPLRLLGWLAAFCCSAAIAAQEKPNIIIVLADDLGSGDLSVMGAPIKTPNIDRLAREGVMLSNAYASANVCTPSRAGLMTGRYPVRTGLAVDVIGPDSSLGLSPEETTVAELLRDAGYATALIGKWHLGQTPEHWPTGHGFDYFFGLLYSNDMSPLRLYRGKDVVADPVDQTQLTALYTTETVNFIRAHAGQPFFILLSHTFPHIPLHASAAFIGKSAAGLYGDAVEELDWSLGEVLAAVAKQGLDDGTLIIFTSDNGAWFEGSNGGLRDMKGLTWDGGYRVPFLARWPGQIPAGTRSAAISMNIDLLPTLAGLAGIGPSKLPPLDGRDVWPVLASRAASPHEKLLLFSDEDVVAIRTQRWKYLERAWYRRNYIAFENIKAAMGFDYPLLFDMDEDNAERYSVADRHPQELQMMRALLEQARSEFEPLRTQPAPAVFPANK